MLGLARYVVHGAGGGGNAPSLNFNFVDGSAFSPQITFTRASSATYFDSAGVLQTATTDVPRFDYNPSTLEARGLLIEEARTNTATYSTEFEDPVYLDPTFGSDLTVTDNAATSPDGTSNAATFTEGTASAVHAKLQRVTGLTANGVYTISLFVKDNTATRGFSLGFGAGTGTAQLNSSNRGNARWDTLAAGPATATTSVSGGLVISTNAVDIGNGWFRLSMTFTFDTANTATSFAFGLGITSGTFAIGTTGDGSSYLIYGFQLEEGEFATSYIPTVASTVTRAVDVAQVNTLSPWYNASEGTLYAEVMLPSLPATGTFPNFVSINNGGSNEVLAISSNDIGARRVNVRSGGASVWDANVGGTLTVNVASKWALGAKSGDFGSAYDGVAGQTSSAVGFPTGLTQMQLGRRGLSNQSTVWLRRVTYYPRRLSDAQLQQITA